MQLFSSTQRLEDLLKNAEARAEQYRQSPNEARSALFTSFSTLNNFRLTADPDLLKFFDSIQRTPERSDIIKVGPSRYYYSAKDRSMYVWEKKGENEKPVIENTVRCLSVVKVFFPLAKHEQFQKENRLSTALVFGSAG